jgi:hypothetical protein
MDGNEFPKNPALVAFTRWRNSAAASRTFAALFGAFLDLNFTRQP